ncbi:unnamed protein product [Rhizophagus irregularis]|nr:unnamed protein product [Rhizophagus irregularis]
MKRIIHFNSLLFRWIICDQQSFSVVENDDFIAFITTLDPRYKLPSRQTVSIKIQEIYESQCKILKTYFSKLSSKVAITTDVWTACTNQAYIVAKFTINPTRNRLNPDKVRASLCLKTWFAAGLIEEDFMKDNDLINE